MFYKKLFAALFLLTTFCTKAQIVAGPMLGHTEFKTATVWAMFSNNIKNATAIYYANNTAQQIQTVPFTFSTNFINTATATLINLQPGTTYTYCIVASNKKDTLAKGNVTTQTLWQWRTPPPNFSFITGSCSYVNEPAVDRPGKPYGGDSSIFLTMAKEKADFMLWLGDNWYLREVDYYSKEGLLTRPSYERKKAEFQPLLKAMPHYAIWDDHDYGFNDADKSYPFKEESLKAFKQFWANPSYGEKNEGIYTKFTWNDVDVFLLDDRYFRSNDAMPDSINGLPTNKQMFGAAQMDWLKNSLLQSSNNRNINFRIIATGSQVLNPISTADCFKNYTTEYNDFLTFLEATKIKGIIFLTGDRHISEIIKVDRKKGYSLYDITASPLTSGTYTFRGNDINNPYRIIGFDNKRNYSRLSFSGDNKNRALTISYLQTDGSLLGSHTITAKELQ
jgi:alkaline phosphatase D